MQKNPSLNNYQILAEKAQNWAKKNSLVITIIAGAVVLGLVGGVVFQYMNNSANEKAVLKYDQAVMSIQSLAYVTNQNERAQEYQNQINNLAGIIQTYPNSIAAMRARIFMGKAFYEEAYRSRNTDSLTKAMGYYTGLVDKGPTAYYKVLGLIGRAQCHEQKNDYVSAYDDYQKAARKYPKEGFTAATLAAMARAKEMQTDASSVQQAVTIYQELADRFPNSAWVSYARGKIAFFKENARQVGTTPAVSTNR